MDQIRIQNTKVFIFRSKLDKIVNFDKTSMDLKINKFPSITFFLLLVGKLWKSVHFAPTSMDSITTQYPSTLFTL
jgi:hypothetical protein